MNLVISRTDSHSRDSVKHNRRIVALKKDGIRPLISAPITGPRSPSLSLLVERYDLEPTDWQMHVHTDQVVAIYLKPSIVQHAPEGENVTEIPVGRGEVVICMRGRSEALRWKESVSFLCVRVSDEALDEAANSIRICDRAELRPEIRMDDVRIRSLLYALEAERASGYPSGHLFLDSIEAALASVLVSSSATTRSGMRLVKGGLPPKRLGRVLEFMRANIERQITLEELAMCAGLSLSHFSHQFRASTNTSPYKYMLSLRIGLSKKMLRNPNLSVLDVSLATGFENQQHFATVFRRMVGVSPSNYRRQV
ncbi:MAG TPA: AraC family transcriptional regulator [Silvibacterium sp.]|nr:AraC family transcriptional regulator [Silvibacterium sp.]